MTFKEAYKEQADLLLTVMGIMDWDGCFALKGGTALNFFYADMPRLSVDIDLVYLPVNSRQKALREIKETLQGYQKKFLSFGFSALMTEGGEDHSVPKLVIARGEAAIKIEPNTILRGSLYPAKKRLLMPAVRRLFGQELEVACLEHNELMAGKLVAMLDRQHPRDIFDMMYFLGEHFALESLRAPLMGYLLQTGRSFSEVLNPKLKNLEEVFHSSFQGMTREAVALEALEKCRADILRKLPEVLGREFEEFLISLLEKKPKWELLPYKNMADYPGIQWKVFNVNKMSSEKVRKELESIRGVFNHIPRGKS